MAKRVAMAYMDTCGPLTMLAIHGFMTANMVWGPQYDDLYDLARIIAPDLPGHGDSETLSGVYEMEMLARQCKELLDGLDQTQKVVLMGMGMGGYIALEFVREYKHRVAGLILVSTRATADNEAELSARKKAITQLKRKGVEALVEDLWPKMFAPHAYKEQPDMVAAMRDIMTFASEEALVNAVRGMMNRADATAWLGDIDVPTLVLHGMEDQLIAPAEAMRLREMIPNAQMQLIPEAGHVPNWEQPMMFNSFVAEFLEYLLEEQS